MTVTNQHKLPILSKTEGFWFQIKNLFFKAHGQAETFGLGNVSPLTLFPHSNKPNAESGYQWQVKTPTPQDAIIKNGKKWRNDWNHFITSEIDSYYCTPNEGMSDIKVNLSNKTSVTIDYIQIKVLYFEEGGKLYKSEYAELFDVSPLSTQKLSVYSSPVGSTLKVYITNVVATAFNLAYSQDSYE